MKLNEDGWLICPKCGCFYMHHIEVRSYTRIVEDGPTQCVKIGYNNSIDWVNDTQNNPSSRRGAVGILFQCEDCGEEMELAIVQHKGNTYFEWREDELEMTPDEYDKWVNDEMFDKEMAKG
jgi:hypothetical protein